jgi:hypothetical protein
MFLIFLFGYAEATSANVVTLAAVAGLKVQKFRVFPKDDFFPQTESLDSRNGNKRVLCAVFESSISLSISNFSLFLNTNGSVISVPNKVFFSIIS